MLTHYYHLLPQHAGLVLKGFSEMVVLPRQELPGCCAGDLPRLLPLLRGHIFRTESRQQNGVHLAHQSEGHLTMCLRYQVRNLLPRLCLALLNLRPLWEEKKDRGKAEERNKGRKGILRQYRGG